MLSQIRDVEHKQTLELLERQLDQLESEVCWNADRSSIRSYGHHIVCLSP